jgi:hypothetical protein
VNCVSLSFFLIAIDYQYMLKNCQKSCNACPGTTKVTTNPTPAEDKDGVLSVSVLFGERQDASGGRSAETMQIVQDTIDYMRTDDFTSLEKKIQESCMNRHELCSFWAMIGTLWNDLT